MRAGTAAAALERQVTALAGHAGGLTRSIYAARTRMAVIEAMLQRGELQRPLEEVQALYRALVMAAPREGDALPLQFPRGRCKPCGKRRGSHMRWSVVAEAWQPWCTECLR